ncbi:MAG: beta-lactamase family protein [Planctomycetaceae bacterium]|nr:beta-lactamase family protein [Planctomycetaceae bacterium]
MMSSWERFPETLKVIKEARDARQHHGVQIYISLQGETLLDSAWGTQGEGESLTAEAVMLWLSAGKPLTTVALGVLHDRGQLDWGDSLGQWIPEWAMFGHPDVTLAQLLMHTAGLENRDWGWPENTWSEIVSKILQSPLPEGWVPGEKAGYVVAASWFLLGEVIVRITSQNFSSALNELVLAPLGMENSFCGLDEEEYQTVEPRLGKMFGRVPGGLENLNWNQRDRVINAAPGGNCRGPIRELGRFYESLLPKADSNILRRETLRDLTSRQRVGMFDETFRHRVDWGYGFMINSNRYGAQTAPYSFGRYAGAETFGHGGSQCAIGFADPEHGLVVAWVANGRIGEPRHHERNLKLNQAIYEDLELVH